MVYGAMVIKLLFNKNVRFYIMAKRLLIALTEQ